LKILCKITHFFNKIWLIHEIFQVKSRYVVENIKLIENLVFLQFVGLIVISVRFLFAIREPKKHGSFLADTQLAAMCLVYNQKGYYYLGGSRKLFQLASILASLILERKKNNYVVQAQVALNFKITVFKNINNKKHQFKIGLYICIFLILSQVLSDEKTHLPNNFNLPNSFYENYFLWDTLIMCWSKVSVNVISLGKSWYFLSNWCRQFNMIFLLFMVKKIIN